MNIVPARAMQLAGSARERGEQQYQYWPGLKTAVRKAVELRLVSMQQKLESSFSSSFIAQQWAFTQQHSPESLQEIDGIAAGYGLSTADLFTYLHLGVIDDRIDAEDGCSILACSNSDQGPILAKNRDYQGEHQELQQVFHQSDPQWGQRRCLFVGSLGSPGAFSSGMNSDGLAIADNRIGWSQPGIGWLRYFLMTKILTSCGSVSEAIELINQLEHVGGGAIVMADKHGELASVELGHGKIHIERGCNNLLAHTNHYLEADLARYATRNSVDPISDSSINRLKVIMTDPLVGNPKPALSDVTKLFASHGSHHDALCRHGVDGDSTTISSVIFCCQSRQLYYCSTPPCKNNWQVYTL
ncbi:MAG: C45 family peptidase [Gammaproteobacteria bacterium]|nr:C45 family peptidase [Gammaproteobacteria bacterium]